MTTIRSRSFIFTIIILLLLDSACTQPTNVAAQIPKETADTFTILAEAGLKTVTPKMSLRQFYSYNL